MLNKKNLKYKLDTHINLRNTIAIITILQMKKATFITRAIKQRSQHWLFSGSVCI